MGGWRHIDQVVMIDAILAFAVPWHDPCRSQLPSILRRHLINWIRLYGINLYGISGISLYWIDLYAIDLVVRDGIGCKGRWMSPDARER